MKVGPIYEGFGYPGFDLHFTFYFSVKQILKTCTVMECKFRIMYYQIRVE